MDAFSTFTLQQQAKGGRLSKKGHVSGIHVSALDPYRGYDYQHSSRDRGTNRSLIVDFVNFVTCIQHLELYLHHESVENSRVRFKFFESFLGRNKTFIWNFRVLRGFPSFVFGLVLASKRGESPNENKRSIQGREAEGGGRRRSLRKGRVRDKRRRLDRSNIAR